MGYAVHALSGISGKHEPLNHAVLAQAKACEWAVQVSNIPAMSSWLAPGHAPVHAPCGDADLTEEAQEGTSPLYFAIVDERVDVVIGRGAL